MDTSDTATPVAFRLSQVSRPSETPFVADSNFILWNDLRRIVDSNYAGDPWSANDQADPSKARHSNGVNILYADGHVKWLQTSRMTAKDPSRAAKPYRQQFLFAWEICGANGANTQCQNDPTDDRLQ